MRRSRGDFCAGTPQALRNKIESVDRVTMASLGALDWRTALGAVTAPTLVIHGTEDFIQLESAREWAATLPNGRLLSVDRSGHFPYLEGSTKLRETGTAAFSVSLTWNRPRQFWDFSSA